MTTSRLKRGRRATGRGSRSLRAHERRLVKVRTASYAGVGGRTVPGSPAYKKALERLWDGKITYSEFVRLQGTGTV